MYLLKLLVFQGIQILVRAPEPSVSTNLSRVRDGENQSIDTSETSLEEQLVAEVNNYYIRMAKINSLKFNDQMTDYKCGSFIRDTDVQKLQHNIFMILNRMFNFWNSQLPTKENVLEDRRRENKIFKLFQTNYVRTICKHIPRCFDFIYICAPTFKNFGNILSLYSNICHLREVYVSKYSDTDGNDTNISLERINSLYNSLSKIKFISLVTNSDTEKEDETFIKNIFKIINKIDTTNMIPSSDWYKKSIFIYYSPPEKLNVRHFRTEPLIDDENRNEVYTLVLSLKRIIFNRGKDLLTANNNYEVPESDENFIISHNLALNDLLLNVLRLLKYNFRNEILKVIEQFSFKENETFTIFKRTFDNVLLKSEYQRICKMIPLILYYLYSVHITDLNVFSLYLTICSNWYQFLYERCLTYKSNSGKWMYDSQCVTQSVNEKLMLNYYMITQKAIYDDNMNNMIVHGLDSLETIIQSINRIFLDFFKFYKSNKVYIWTSFDWLSSYQIFIQILSSEDLIEIREQTVTFGEINRSISITMLYYQILPWNANLKTLIDFKIIVDKIVFYKFCQYVKSHAVNIYIYFELTNENDVNDGVISRLKKSNQWYKLGFRELYNFMKSTTEGLKIPDECKSDIEAIEKISVITIGQFKHFIKEKYEKSSKIKDILSNMKSDYVTELNQIFLKNCVDAIHFINKYILFLNSTDGLPYKLKINDVQELCKKDNLDNVFNVN
jgi:hypothetical protein